jgi:hypothetical protein
MRNIKEYKLYEVTQAMIDGLLYQSTRPDFAINMETYGGVYDICFGCAATCTIQQVTGFNFTKDNVINYGSRFNRYESLGNQSVFKDYLELDKFEKAINSLRNSFVNPICEFLKIDFDVVCPVAIESRLVRLFNNSWKDDLPKYQEFANKLKELNI